MHLERPQSIAVIDRRRISALKETQAEALRGVPLRFIIISSIWTGNDWPWIESGR